MRAMVAAWILSAGLLVALAGCGRTLASRRGQMLDAYAQETSCPRSSLHTRRLIGRIYRVSGCGGYVDYAQQFSVVPQRRSYVSYSGVGRVRHSWQPISGIHQVAPVELGCLDRGLSYVQLSPTYYEVTGCGRGAAFELQCGGFECGWVAGEVARVGQ